MSNCDLRGELAQAKLRIEQHRAVITKLNEEIAQLRMGMAGLQGAAAGKKCREEAATDEPIPDDYYIDDEKREPTNDKSTH